VKFLMPVSALLIQSCKVANFDFLDKKTSTVKYPEDKRQLAFV